MTDTAGAIHQCISAWGWAMVAQMPAPQGIWPTDWKGTGHYLRFANFMDQDCDSHRIYYCPVCGVKLDA